MDSGAHGPGTLHHVELWVPDLPRATAEWGWLLGELDYVSFQDWPDGHSWRLGGGRDVATIGEGLSRSYFGGFWADTAERSPSKSELLATACASAVAAREGLLAPR
jgi:hypothetical protein